MTTDKKYSQNIVNVDKSHKHKYTTNISKVVFGFIVFLVIFMIIIPLLLLKNKQYNLLEAYMPNIDLIATVITWHGGLFNIWEHLYPPTPLTIYGFSSQTFINYMALLGLTYIVIRETKRTNSIIKGWAFAFVMLLMTYLLPSQVISYTMDNISELLNQSILSRILVLISGFLITGLIIMSEAYVLENYKTQIENVVQKILNIPKLLKK